jgi:hypothetical protein
MYIYIHRIKFGVIALTELLLMSKCYTLPCLAFRLCVHVYFVSLLMLLSEYVNT